MTPSIALLLVILAIALVLFSTERLPVDVVGLGVMLALILTRLVTPEQAFAGFGSETFLLLLGLLILTAALVRTGVVDIAGRTIIRLTGNNPRLLLVMIMGGAAALSSFISNTASTAFFLPVALGLAQRLKVSASRLLMPLAFASILTSSVTLISTSTNIVVSGLMVQYDLAPLAMFELAPVGIPIALVGLAYMLLIGHRLMPERETPADMTEEFGLRPFLTEVIILPQSNLAGKTLSESGLGRDLDLTVLRVVRDKTEYLAPTVDLELQSGDVLLVEGARDEILKVKDRAGIDIKADFKLSDPDLESEDMRLVEVILLQRSPLIGRTLKGIRFREQYGLQVLAVHRGEGTIRRKISQVPLRMGDVLLVQGHRRNIALMQEDRTFQLMGAVNERRPNVRRAPMAIGIFVLMLALSSMKILSLPVAMLLGALLVFVTRCITPEEAYREVEWKALILIGSMLALGAGMEHTGAASFLAMQITTWVGHFAPVWLLGAFFIVTLILTQPMSNQAAAVVIVPVAIQTAIQLGLNPRSFAVMIAVAASCSFLTPLEPSCLMVYGPGRYKFFDFVKVGSLLTVLIFLIAILFVPIIWPLE